MSFGQIIDMMHREEALKPVIRGILEDCSDTDWVYDGEDERPVNTFDIDRATREIVAFILERDDARKTDN